MAAESTSETSTTAPTGPSSSPPTQAPERIDGAAIFPPLSPGSPPNTPGTVTPSLTSDGRPTTSTLLFQSGDVRITRDEVPSGNQFANTVVIHTGTDDDNVQISQRRDGVLEVQINGQPFEIRLGPDQQLGTQMGAGNDVVRVADNVTYNMDVRGGEGNDTITTGRGRDRVDGGLGDDTIQTGAGRDDAFGNSGNDTIDTGDGNDVAYGGDGVDRISGGRGKDYLEGGDGNDVLDGGDDNDILSGGLGDDTLRGARGNDHVYTGTGADTVDNQSGRDKVFGQAGTDTLTATNGARNNSTEVNMTDADPSKPLGHSIRIDGTDEFKQRVQADIEMLRSSPTGRQMLAELDLAARSPAEGGKGHSVTIREMSNNINGSAGPDAPDVYLRRDASGATIAGPGTNAVVRYNPSNHNERFQTPIDVLYHELNHANNIVNGTIQPGTYTEMSADGSTSVSVRNAERQAVGLSNDGLLYDFDRDPNTRPTRGNPESLTENGLRDEFDITSRDRYYHPDDAKGVPGSLAAAGGSSRISDEYLAAMLSAMESGNSQALREATQALAKSSFGDAFRQEGAGAYEQHVQQQHEKLHASQTPQIELDSVQSTGGMRR